MNIISKYEQLKLELEEEYQRKQKEIAIWYTDSKRELELRMLADEFVPTGVIELKDIIRLDYIRKNLFIGTYDEIKRYSNNLDFPYHSFFIEDKEKDKFIKLLARAIPEIVTLVPENTNTLDVIKPIFLLRYLMPVSDGNYYFIIGSKDTHTNEQILDILNKYI